MIENKSFLIVGDYSWPWYQEACVNALNDLGFQAEKFSWFDDFRYRPEGVIEPVYKNLWLRLQYRFNLGPKVREVEKRLINQALDLQPNFIWFYNVRLINPNTVKQLRQKLPNTKFIQYANDNPFSPHAKYKFWSNFIKSIPYFDLTLSYRKNNLEAYKSSLRPPAIPPSVMSCMAVISPESIAIDASFTTLMPGLYMRFCDS